MRLATKRAEAGTSTLIQSRPGRRSNINPHKELMMQPNITPGVGPAMSARACPICGTVFTPSRHSQRTCTEACKKRLARSENRDANASKTPSRLWSYRTPQKPQFARSQVIEKSGGVVPVFDDLDGTTPLVFERINEITFKVTDGKKIRHPAGIGLPGADQSRGLGWLMEIGWFADRQAWIARVADRSFGPASLAKAKSAALQMIAGKEVACDRLLNSIGYLNFQQLALLDGEAR